MGIIFDGSKAIITVGGKPIEGFGGDVKIEVNRPDTPPEHPSCRTGSIDIEIKEGEVALLPTQEISVGYGYSGDDMVDAMTYATRTLPPSQPYSELTSDMLLGTVRELVNDVVRATGIDPEEYLNEEQKIFERFRRLVAVADKSEFEQQVRKACIEGRLSQEYGDELMAMMSGRERQAAAVREEEERRARERNDESRILRTLRDPNANIPGVMLPEFVSEFVRSVNRYGRANVIPPREFVPGPRVTFEERIDDEEDIERKKKEAAERKRVADEQRKAEEERRKKYTYQPGMAMSEYVQRQMEIAEGERLKWLKTFFNCVLPDDVRDIVYEALTTVLMSKKFEEWGVNESFEKGLTNSILLYGPPGTGKTMIAESFAAVLGKDLLKVTSADIQSQVPGEAERNIIKNFELAKKHDAVLMFDECDSLLYDRNAVGMIMASEINQLLTEIERFDGVCILTTNRLERLDPALQRRIIAKVELPLPNEAARLQIWQNLMPKKTPVGDDVDYSLLAKVELSGGEIKNVILTAIRKAVAQNAPKVTADHFVFACKAAMKAKKDFEDRRPTVVPHEDITHMGLDKVMTRDLRKVGP